MLRTKILAERESFFQDGVVFDRQHILIDQMALKFGISEKIEKRIKSVKSADKLDKGLQEIFSAENREVLKCLD